LWYISVVHSYRSFNMANKTPTLSSIFRAFSNPQEDIVNLNQFPLDAYLPASPPVAGVASQARLPSGPVPPDPVALTSQAPTPRGINAAWVCIRVIFMLVVNAWIYYHIAIDFAGFTCFSTFSPTTLRPPICDSISSLLHYSSQSTYSYIDGRHMHVRQLSGFVQRDFALRGAGAIVLPELTSTTYRPAEQRLAVGGQITLPTIVLDEQVSIGDCWEFRGSSGHIGITLSEYVNFTSMSIHYVHPSRVSSKMIQKAPRSLTLWALVDPLQLSSKDVRPDETRRPIEFLTSRDLPPAINPSHIFVQVLKAEYVIDGSNPVQVFAPSVSASTWVPYVHSIASAMVVVEINSNWGSNTTCLHHIGLHGVSPF